MEKSSAVTSPARSPSKAKKQSRLLRWLKRTAKILLLVYIGLLLVLYSLQNYFVFPGRSSQGQGRAIIRESTAYELVHLTTRRGEKTVAIFGAAQDENGQPRADAKSQPTILFFYGNAMCLADCFSQLEQFRKLGCNVMIPEYLGFGLATGKPSETALYETADAAYDALQSRSDIDPHKIIVAGWSLGAAVAIDLAHRRPVAGLATFSAFTNLKSMASRLIPFVPVSLALSYRFDNLGKIADIQCPIFIVHGSHDSIVPHDMARQLVDAAVRSREVKHDRVDSDHNDVFEVGAELWEPLARWVDGLRRSL